MKVIVSFTGNNAGSSHKIVVPCDDGNITVQELAKRAAVRYSRVFLKGESSKEILLLKLLNVNAILDFGDTVKDVVGNNELLTACFIPHDGEYELNDGEQIEVNLSNDGEQIRDTLKNVEDKDVAGNQTSDGDCRHQKNMEQAIGIKKLEKGSSSPNTVLRNVTGSERPEAGQMMMNGYKCGACFAIFQDLEQFKHHQSTHTQDILESPANKPGISKSSKYPSPFAEQYNLDCHLSENNQEVQGYRRMRYVRCAFCGKMLKKEYRNMKYKLLFVCSECIKSTQLERGFKVENQYRCPVRGCKKVFGILSTFERHIIKHQKNQTFLANLQTKMPAPVSKSGNGSKKIIKESDLDVEIGHFLDFVAVQDDRGAVYETELSNHEYITIQDMLPCKLCGDVFREEGSFREHLC